MFTMNFFARGVSAINVSTDIIVGRPYGGTAILYEKSIAHRISLVGLQSNNSRVTGMVAF